MSDCVMCKALATERLVWEDATWAVRHIEPPHGLAGWMMMVSKRHVASVAAMNDAEAASFGPTLRWLESTLLTVTGAPRIYTAALGEAVPHLHVHMVPRYDTGAKGWALFDVQRAAAAGEVVVDAANVAAVCARYAAALAARP